MVVIVALALAFTSEMLKERKSDNEKSTRCNKFFARYTLSQISYNRYLQGGYCSRGAEVF